MNTTGIEDLVSSKQTDDSEATSGQIDVAKTWRQAQLMNIGDAGRAGPQFVAAGDTVYSRKNFPPDIKSLICGIYGRRDGMIKVTYLGKWFRGPQSPAVMTPRHD